LQRSVENLVGAGRGTEARIVVLATVVLGVAFWLGDAVVDHALSRGATFLDEVLHPSAAEIWVRLLVTVLLVGLYVGSRSRARLRLLNATLDEAPDGVQIASLDGTIAYSNQAVREIYGFAPDELRGKNVNDMNADPGFASRVILPSLRRDGRWAGEIDVKHKDGRIFPVWLTASVVLSTRGTPLASVGIIRDLTARKREQEELRRYAERLEQATRLKDLFADILRHDLLGPVSVLHMSLRMLERNEPGSPAWRRFLANAQGSCGKLTQMIDDAARYAKVSTTQEMEFGEIDLGEVLKRVIAEFELPLTEARAQVSCSATGSYAARASPIIAEVFWNLLSNAIKYGAPGGPIGVEIDDLGASWKVSISDRGEGIPEADKPKVFTRFERLGKESVKGTGLGLAISKHIVDMHGGRIWAEDNPGGGSVFCVTVPKAP
jgi:PAS domain S-box-containing protein